MFLNMEHKLYGYHLFYVHVAFKQNCCDISKTVVQFCICTTALYGFGLGTTVILHHQRRHCNMVFIIYLEHTMWLRVIESVLTNDVMRNHANLYIYCIFL